MRIVIIGEFSSFAKNLSEGFRALGHECFVFSWGDGFKDIVQENGSSYNVHLRTPVGNSKFEHIANGLYSLKSAIKLNKDVKSMTSKKKWDTALIINQSFIKQKGKFWNAQLTIDMIKKLLVNPENIYLSACGRDIPYCDYWGSIDNKNSSLVKILSSGFLNERMISHHRKCMKYIKKVIPVMYDYAEAWRKSKYGEGCTICETIPLPVSCNKFEVHNIISDKLFVFHGITRPKHKGSYIIKEAMNKIESKYSERVVCEAEGGMRLDDYLKLIDKANILIDQTYSYGYGMNALYGLAQGKVVLSGNEVENQKEYGTRCPIINIKPDINQIYEQLERLVSNPNMIEALSLKSREYVENVHDSKVIAQKYIDTFKKYNQ